MSDDSHGILVGIGNPLLDITANVTSDLLEKYNLEEDDAVLASDSQMEIYEDLRGNHEVVYTAGGSVQNSLRVCQWILGKPKRCVMIGSVGYDQYSKILEKTARSDGVTVKYQYHDGVPTGTCAVLIYNNKRSLCANLAAAERFTIDHIHTPENFKIIEKAEVYYITGFFLTVSPETAFEIGYLASKENKIFVNNLSANFICQNYYESLLKLVAYADILFGNETEAITFGRALGFETKDITEIALKLSALPKNNDKRKRVVVITQGSLPVVYAYDRKVETIPVMRLAPGEIVDTNGAGDAFAGGFLSQLLLGKSIKECINCAIWAATHVIKHSGCVFDREVLYSPK